MSCETNTSLSEHIVWLITIVVGNETWNVLNEMTQIVSICLRDSASNKRTEEQGVQCDDSRQQAMQSSTRDRLSSSTISWPHWVDNVFGMGLRVRPRSWWDGSKTDQPKEYFIVCSTERRSKEFWNSEHDVSPSFHYEAGVEGRED